MGGWAIEDSYAPATYMQLLLLPLLLLPLLLLLRCPLLPLLLLLWCPLFVVGSLVGDRALPVGRCRCGLGGRCCAGACAGRSRCY